MIPLLVPTRNRPTELASLLAYLAAFYPQATIIIADGSDAPQRDRVAALCDGFAGRLALTLHRYPAELPLFERLLDASLSAPHELIAVGADDDYPLLEVAGEAAALLMADATASAAVAGNIMLHLAATGKMKAVLSVSRTIAQTTAAERMAAYANWSFATSYGVARATALVARYRSLAKVNCPGFVDFQAGVEDCLSGRVLALPRIGVLRTHSAFRSYFRPADKLVYLRRAADVLAMRDHIAARLAACDGIGEAAAVEAASAAVSRRIAELSGGSLRHRHGFAQSAEFRQTAVQRQFRDFYAMFAAKSPIHAAHAARLHHAARALMASRELAAGQEAPDYEEL